MASSFLPIRLLLTLKLPSRTSFHLSCCLDTLSLPLLCSHTIPYVRYQTPPKMKARFQALSIVGLFASLPCVSGRVTGDRHHSGYSELNTEIEPPTMAPTAGPTPLLINKADEDPDELLEDSPGAPPRTIDGGNGLSPSGIIGISIGSAFLILAAIGVRRKRRNQEDDKASAALSPAGVSADPGDFGPI
eukprot:scaffold7349_cov173-Amphora_coffeaeformis.AAC.124